MTLSILFHFFNVTKIHKFIFRFYFFFYLHSSNNKIAIAILNILFKLIHLLVYYMNNLNKNEICRYRSTDK